MTHKIPRTEDEFKTQVSLYNIKSLYIRDCSVCRYRMQYLFDNNKVYLDTGCFCTDYESVIKEQSWRHIADFYNRQTNPKLISKLDKLFHFET